MTYRFKNNRALFSGARCDLCDKNACMKSLHPALKATPSCFTAGSTKPKASSLESSNYTTHNTAVRINHTQKITGDSTYVFHLHHRVVWDHAGSVAVIHARQLHGSMMEYTDR